MLRFITLSLAVHGLVIGAWYYQEAQPDEISGGRTLALALLPPAAAVANSRLSAQTEHGTPDTADTEQPGTTPGPSNTHTVEKQMPMQNPAPRRQPVSVRSSQPAVAGPTEIPDTAEMAVSERANPVAASTAPATDKLPARQAVETAVSMALRENFRYPRIARRYGWEGTVILSLRVLPDGQLEDILVSSSSGHPVLDRAAIQSLQTARVPQARQWLNERAIDLVLPVEYRLLDS